MTSFVLIPGAGGSAWYWHRVVPLLRGRRVGGALAWARPDGLPGAHRDRAAGNVTTPWVWLARPPHDVGGALCAVAVFAAGARLVTVRGTRESVRD